MVEIFEKHEKDNKKPPLHCMLKINHNDLKHQVRDHVYIHILIKNITEYGFYSMLILRIKCLK